MSRIYHSLKEYKEKNFQNAVERRAKIMKICYNEQKEKIMHEGHRQRMLKRLLSSAESLQDHELLEVLLFYAIPRRNTNDLAHELIDRFGSLEGVFRATPEQLKQVKGVGDSTAALIRTVGLFASRLKSEKASEIHLFNVGSFSSFLIKRYGNLRDEVLELFCIDANDRVKFIKDFTSYSGTQVKIPAGEVTALLASHRPFGLVLAHNHPNGSPLPSKEDDKFTAQLQVLCSINGTKVYDHIIVSGTEYYSYKLHGRMDDINRNFSIDSVLRRGME